MHALFNPFITTQANVSVHYVGVSRVFAKYSILSNCTSLKQQLRYYRRRYISHTPRLLLQCAAALQRCMEQTLWSRLRCWAQWHWYFTHFKLFYFPNIIGLVRRIVRFVMRTELLVHVSGGRGFYGVSERGGVIWVQGSHSLGEPLEGRRVPMIFCSCVQLKRSDREFFLDKHFLVIHLPQNI